MTRLPVVIDSVASEGFRLTANQCTRPPFAVSKSFLSITRLFSSQRWYAQVEYPKSVGVAKIVV